MENMDKIFFSHFQTYNGMAINITYKRGLKDRLLFLAFCPYNGTAVKESREKLTINTSLFFLVFSPYNEKTRSSMSIINNTRFYLKPYFDSG